MFNNFLCEFKSFIEKGNAIDMAVGIIVGSTMTGVVNSLVKDIIMPPIGLLIGGVDFSQLFIVLSGEGARYSTVAAAQSAGATTLNIGLFINSLTSFLITMFAMFLFVRTVNKIRGKSLKRTCPYCKSSIDAMATKCPNCCSEVKPEKVEKSIIDSTVLVSKIKRKIKKVIK
ncbi:MAG: large conductance mechanosensitive channel protein MscL [Alphaproteobacteria bacterium]|nr:large conductance mechanosensitive channel protein MscL [Alphaproteobacteria bacterium]